ncbi:hypothetical protein P7C70_g6103, partial [Phenoliferia sp. Uapishka_3]
PDPISRPRRRSRSLSPQRSYHNRNSAGPLNSYEHRGRFDSAAGGSQDGSGSGDWSGACGGPGEAWGPGVTGEAVGLVGSEEGRDEIRFEEEISALRELTNNRVSNRSTTPPYIAPPISSSPLPVCYPSLQEACDTYLISKDTMAEVEKVGWVPGGVSLGSDLGGSTVAALEIAGVLPAQIAAVKNMDTKLRSRVRRIERGKRQTELAVRGESL